jgi:CYTH domain-containing protein
MDSPPSGGIAGGAVIERERRFLVASLPDPLPVPTQIVQAYLYTQPVSVRVRREDQRHTLTLKAGSGRTRTEIEHDIDPDEFEALWNEAAELRIAKRRHRIELDHGLTAELDLYDGDLSGRRIVEVEFPDEASADAFVAPSWFGPEVTDDNRYTNSSLARRGWPTN